MTDITRMENETMEEKVKKLRSDQKEIRHLLGQVTNEQIRQGQMLEKLYLGLKFEQKARENRERAQDQLTSVRDAALRKTLYAANTLGPIVLMILWNFFQHYKGGTP